MASLTGCSPGSLLFDYLGLPIGSSMNKVSRWNTLVDRFRAKLSSWKANLLSIGGRFTLLKTVLGVASLKSLNLALLKKWRQRFLTQPNAFWVSLIKVIHGENRGLDSARCVTHGTWANMVASIHALHLSDIIPNNTIWLFRLDVNEDCYMADRWYNNSWNGHWRRPIEGGRTGGKDGVFTVSDTCKHIENAILPVINSSTRWNKFLPRKISVFMRRLWLDRLPHRLNLSRPSFDIDSILCPIYLKTAETKDHVFSTCELAFDVWRLVGAIFLILI
ncbi:RNA-directed DNA polymerase, eukaryota, reverse transcriptase zinc-binding domain protein [Tanacetum coccineum]